MMNDGRPMTIKDAYAILDVKESQSLDSIKQSYRRAVRLYHPDVQTGLSDAEKFSRIVTAYNMITDERKKGRKAPGHGQSGPGNRSQRPRERKQGVTLRFFEGVGSLFHWFTPPVESRQQSRERPPSSRRSGQSSRFPGESTFDELVVRFDRSRDIWMQIEAAHSIFDRHRPRFEVFALLRLKRCKPAVLAELITLLGRLGHPSALRAVAPYITSRDREVLLAAFVALDGAGDAGYAIIDYYLSPPSALMYSLTALFRRSDFENRVLRQRLIPPHKLRRLSAIRRHTGVPLRELLEGIGVVVPGSV